MRDPCRKNPFRERTSVRLVGEFSRAEGEYVLDISRYEKAPSHSITGSGAGLPDPALRDAAVRHRRRNGDRRPSKCSARASRYPREPAGCHRSRLIQQIVPLHSFVRMMEKEPHGYSHSWHRNGLKTLDATKERIMEQFQSTRRARSSCPLMTGFLIFSFAQPELPR
jgi:hypothetical protein